MNADIITTTVDRLLSSQWSLTFLGYSVGLTMSYNTVILLCNYEKRRRKIIIIIKGVGFVEICPFIGFVEICPFTGFAIKERQYRVDLVIIKCKKKYDKLLCLLKPIHIV